MQWGIHPGPINKSDEVLSVGHINVRIITTENRLKLFENFLCSEINLDVICMSETHLDSGVLMP